jgi:biotin carboxyl carrier protein
LVHSPSMFRLDLDLIRHALQTASDHGFATVEVGLGEDRFEAKFLPRKGGAKAVSVAAAEAEEEAKAVAITAPSVGYFRPGPIPLAVGQQIETGDVVGEIVALGLKNDVAAKSSGVVVQVMVQAEDPVEYGQTIATLRPEA